MLLHLAIVRLILVPLGSISRHGFLAIPQHGVLLETIDYLFDKNSQTFFPLLTVLCCYCRYSIHTVHPQPGPVTLPLAGPPVDSLLASPLSRRARLSLRSQH